MATKVLYHRNGGTLILPPRFADDMFKKYPPHTPEGRQLWHPLTETPVQIFARSNLRADTDAMVEGYVRLVDERGNPGGLVATVGRYGADWFGPAYYTWGPHTHWRDLPFITAELGCASCLANFSRNARDTLRITHVPAGANYRVKRDNAGKEIIKLYIDAAPVINELLERVRGVAGTQAGSTALQKLTTLGSFEAAEADLKKARDALDAAFQRAPCQGTCYRL